MTWNQRLADDVVLSLRLGTLAINQVGGPGGITGHPQVTGREEAKWVPLLAVSSLSAFGLAVALPHLPLAHWLGFVPMPALVVCSRS
ncbi:MAG: hypothetical protein WA446_11205 [Steroidobacteraceae bacterium]